MPYILSKLSNSQNYTQYAKGLDGDQINIPIKSVYIKGGADVTNKNLETPEGIVNKVSADDLAFLLENKDFQSHLEKGYVKYYDTEPNVDKEVEKMTKDNSKQLTKSDYTKKGKKAPKTESII